MMSDTPASSEDGTSPAEDRREPGVTSAPERQGGTSPAEPRQNPGVSLQEASLRLDLSERTIRRMLQEGELQGYKQKATRGYVWRVVLDDAPVPEPGISSANGRHEAGSSPAAGGGSEQQTPNDETTPTGDLARALSLIEQMHQDQVAELERLRRENQQLAGQLGFTQAKLQEAEKQIALLMAPKDPEPAEPEQPAEPERVSWWKRLWGR